MQAARDELVLVAHLELEINRLALRTDDARGDGHALAQRGVGEMTNLDLAPTVRSLSPREGYIDSRAVRSTRTITRGVPSTADMPPVAKFQVASGADARVGFITGSVRPAAQRQQHVRPQGLVAGLDSEHVIG